MRSAGNACATISHDRCWPTAAADPWIAVFRRSSSRSSARRLSSCARATSAAWRTASALPSLGDSARIGFSFRSCMEFRQRGWAQGSPVRGSPLTPTGDGWRLPRPRADACVRRRRDRTGRRHVLRRGPGKVGGLSRRDGLELRDDRREDVNAPVQRLAADGQWRGEADHCSVGVLAQHAAFGHALDDRARGDAVCVEFNADPEAAAAHGAINVESTSRRRDSRCAPSVRLRSTSCSSTSTRSASSATRAASGLPPNVDPWLPAPSGPAPRHARRRPTLAANHRRAPCRPARRRVGCPLHVREHRTGTAEAGLDFVEDQQHAR